MKGIRVRRGVFTMVASVGVWLPAGGDLAAQSRVVAVRAGALIDGTGADPVREAVVVITDGRITAVGSGVAIPRGAELIDLSGMTVLPGFVDAHTHLTAPIIGAPGWESDRVRYSPAHVALRAASNAREVLEAGYTSAREVGAPKFTDVALRDAINSGWAAGPRMQVAAHALGITGGHCDLSTGFAPGALGYEPGIEEGNADGPEEIRRAIRYQVKYGADLIKICATGGVISFGDSVGVQQYGEEELRAVVQYAHLVERRVAAHAHGTAGIKAAVRAGVNSIEHGTLLDDEGIRLMAERGTYLVSTLMAGGAIIEMANDGRLTGQLAEKALVIGPQMPRTVHRAWQAGVPIALGTDNIFDPHSTDGREFSLLVEAGLPPMDAIVAGTKNGAELMGWGADVGTIQSGRYGDLVGVRGDPLEDITLLERVDFVMQGGEVVKLEP